MTKHEDLPYLEHILEAINNIQESVKDISKKQFSNSKDKKDANVRRLEIIGEATKNLSKRLREKYKNVEWNKITGTRDKVIHAYSKIDLDIVWDIIKKDLPNLKQKILLIKRDIEKHKKI